MTRPADPSATTRDFTVETTDGARLAVSILQPRAGRGAPMVVLSHGWAAGRRVWADVADHLRDAGHPVLVYDQRGHGASTLGREPISIKRLAADLAAVLSHVDASSAIVVGHSGGGFAAMAYAASHPEANARVRGLVLLATAAHDQETPDGEVRMMGSRLFSWALARPWIGRRMLAQTMGKSPDRNALELHRQMFAATPAQVRADCFRSSRGMDLREGLRSVTIPAIVLAGTVDKVVAPALGQAIADAMPRAKFEWLPGLGHMLPLEAPDRVAHAVRAVSAG